jgi:DNA-binding transcriptional LysR family regulator
MHIETLKIFCDLVELESFSKTAEKHFLSQSAVSQQLAQLELTHKVQLLDRKKRPLAPTAAGQLFYNACKDIVERYEQLKSELNVLQKPSAGRINVVAIYSIGMHTLPDYVKKFMVKYPDVNVHIEYLSSVRIYELVLSGEADIGLVAVPRRDKRLEVYDFVDEPLVLVCSPKHPLAGESQIDIHKVQFERFIAFEKDTPTRGLIDSILQRYNIVVRPVMEFDNTETIKRAIEINAGISILPENTIVQEVSSRTIKAIPFLNERFFRPTGIIVRKDKILGLASRYFIELLRKKS